jgi:hypothetical protein
MSFAMPRLFARIIRKVCSKPAPSLVALINFRASPLQRAMTNYSSWDSKAAQLCREAEEEDAKAKAENDKALGLEEGPKGPPTAKAEKEMSEMTGHSKDREKFIEWSKEREVNVTHSKQDEPVVLDTDEVKNKAVRLINSEDVKYIVPEGSGIVKLMLDRCKRVQVQVVGTLITATIEACRCDEVDLELSVPIGTMQVDECTSPLRVVFGERDHVGRIYHQNSPGLSLGWNGVGSELHVVGLSEAAQFSTRLEGVARAEVVTVPVRRGEGEFPIDLPGQEGSTDPAEAQPEPETAPAAEERRRKAELRRNQGNDMFRANDFYQAAMEYTQALELDSSISALWANRSQCWLKLGDHEKALEDAKKCSEVDPTNPKGWFRQGMSLQAMKKYSEAIPCYLEAEKLEPQNTQTQEAIKLAQLMARRQASSGY